MDDVARDLSRARLAVELKEATPRRELIRRALRAGIRPEYLAVRYAVPVEQIRSAKLKWEREDEQERKRKSVRSDSQAP